jgi:hypothetical protein
MTRVLQYRCNRPPQVNNFHYNRQLVGYANEYRWSIFDPEENKFVCNDTGDAPNSIIVDDGFSYLYSPFLTIDPNSRERSYCVRLAEWWRCIQRRRKQWHANWVHSGVDGANAQVAHANAVRVSPLKKTQREHRLIGEVVVPRNRDIYIDCTVEVSRNLS